MNKKNLDRVEKILSVVKFDFFKLISDPDKRSMVAKITGISESNLCNYASGKKQISIAKILEIYKKIL